MHDPCLRRLFAAFSANSAAFQVALHQFNQFVGIHQLYFAAVKPRHKVVHACLIHRPRVHVDHRVAVLCRRADGHCVYCRRHFVKPIRRDVSHVAARIPQSKAHGNERFAVAPPHASLAAAVSVGVKLPYSTFYCIKLCITMQPILHKLCVGGVGDVVKQRNYAKVATLHRFRSLPCKLVQMFAWVTEAIGVPHARHARHKIVCFGVFVHVACSVGTDFCHTRRKRPTHLVVARGCQSLSESTCRCKVALQPLNIVAVGHHKRNVVFVWRNGGQVAVYMLFQNGVLATEVTVIYRPVGRQGIIAEFRNVTDKRNLVIVPTVNGNVWLQFRQHVLAKSSVFVTLARVHARPTVGNGQVSQPDVEVVAVDHLMHKSAFVQLVVAHVKHCLLSLGIAADNLTKVDDRVQAHCRKSVGKHVRHPQHVVYRRIGGCHVYAYVATVQFVQGNTAKQRQKQFCRSIHVHTHLFRVGNV